MQDLLQISSFCRKARKERRAKLYVFALTGTEGIRQNLAEKLASRLKEGYNKRNT